MLGVRVTVSLTMPVAWTVAVHPAEMVLPAPAFTMRYVVPLQPGAGVYAIRTSLGTLIDVGI